jgi:hypothetical protein
LPLAQAAQLFRHHCVCPAVLSLLDVTYKTHG